MAREPVVFLGMCDASGAVPLSADRFAVADDEDNVLRVYDANRGGPPLWQKDLSDQLGLPQRPPKKSGKPRPPPETDLEAATRIGDVALWLTSHGRNSAGEEAPERVRLFATTLPRGDDQGLELMGRPVTQLLDALLADPRYTRFDLAHASQLAPKAPGGLNIEGMTARNEGGVWIGLRSPVPEGHALVLPLHNPLAVVRDQAALALGDPVLLDLQGRGVRALSYWHGQYLIAAGHTAEQQDPRLFLWDGTSANAKLAAVQPPPELNPEGFFTPEERSEFLVLSDDGSVSIEGKPCKKQKDPRKKRFRGAWLTL